jgi:hypothetical protein
MSKHSKKPVASRQAVLAVGLPLGLPFNLEDGGFMLLQNISKR